MSNGDTKKYCGATIVKWRYRMAWKITILMYKNIYMELQTTVTLLYFFISGKVRKVHLEMDAQIRRINRYVQCFFRLPAKHFVVESWHFLVKHYRLSLFSISGYIDWDKSSVVNMSLAFAVNFQISE